MKKDYCIAILMLIISVLASNACAISATEGATAENGQNADQVAANQAATDQVPSPLPSFRAKFRRPAVRGAFADPPN